MTHIETVEQLFNAYSKKDARRYILETIKAALMEGDRLTYERILSRLVPGGISWEASLLLAAIPVVRRAAAKGDLGAAYEFCLKYNELKEIQ